MASAPLNWLLKIGGDTLNTVSQTLSGAVNELKQDLSSAVTTLIGRFSTINNIEDVNITSPSDGQFLGYDGTNEEWKNVNGNFMNTNGSNAANEVTFAGAFTVGSRASGSTVGSHSTAEGEGTISSGGASHAEGISTTASANGAHAEGWKTTASGAHSHAEGYNTTASGYYSHAEGYSTEAAENYAHAEGQSTIASGTAAHAEGVRTKATKDYSHAEGADTTASGYYSHAEGSSATASGNYSHAEGGSTTASGNGAHAEGENTTASGAYSHAEGQGTTASGSWTHAGGRYVNAARNYSFVHGNYDDSSKKFRSTTMDGYGQAFGFAMSGDEVKTDTAITTSKNGCQGCIEDTATVTLSIEPQGMYLLIVDAFTISTGALYGATVNLITGHGLATGTPTNTVIKATSNAPATIATAANNKITIKNGAATRATQFTLIRVA